jgi:hypothetical protein
VIHTFVTSSALSSSTTVSLAAHQLNQSVGRDVKSCKHRFSAAVGATADKVIA